jgi:flagellin
MVVQHNMQAANASRMLGITTNAQSKSTEKLSSGFRINRAADDAAGLSISEKMRKQIRGLDQASTNASDGISAVQTAEGALTEVHSMLQRMNELAVQAANGTNSESDRSSIQDEINQLTTEIDRVAETTKFNETYLLKGYNGDKTIRISAHDAGLEGVLSQNTISGTFTMKKLEVGDTYKIGGTEYSIGAKDVEAAKTAIKFDEDSTGVIQIDGKSWTLVGDGDTNEELFELSNADLAKYATNGSTLEYNGKSVTIFSEANKDDSTAYVDPNNKTLITSTEAYNLIQNELQAASNLGATTTTATVDAATASGSDKMTFLIHKGTATSKNDLTFNLHVGSDADMTNKIGVTIEAMTAKSLGLDGVSVNDATGKSATYVIDSISDALAKVSAQRSALGAVQNRLEHSIANLDNVVENTNAAESRIRDTDMADEMVTYSKNNILAQAGQSMLAQANQATQGVLSLLG